jgi:hypothetical protein
VSVHVVQTKTIIIQENKQQNYEISNNEKGYGNNQIIQGQIIKIGKAIEIISCIIIIS